jgi:hypothetical protein
MTDAMKRRIERLEETSPQPLPVLMYSDSLPAEPSSLGWWWRWNPARALLHVTEWRWDGEQLTFAALCGGRVLRQGPHPVDVSRLVLQISPKATLTAADANQRRHACRKCVTGAALG